MAQKPIREYDVKRAMARYFKRRRGGLGLHQTRLVLVTPDTDLATLGDEHPWLAETRLVVKPDQLVGKRGKHGLLLTDATLDEAREWLTAKMGSEATIGGRPGTLHTFLIEPFVPHDTEYYIAIRSQRDCDEVLFSLEGGINIEDNWDRVIRLEAPVDVEAGDIRFTRRLPKELGPARRKVGKFISELYRFYARLGFSYLEINPFALTDDEGCVPLDAVARIDDTSLFQTDKFWETLVFPEPFGQRLTPEEQHVRELDEGTGASLKLTLLNPQGRIWTMVAGGGASVIFADTVADLGYADELANYGEYSGDPNAELTQKYAETILDLMTHERDPRGKVLLIGGGIANFTDVAVTFRGIIAALKAYRERLIENDVRIFVRRGGPNYKEGLENMRALGSELGVPIAVHGPETHMTHIVATALGGEA